ncbi:MAG: hypothetical protein ACQEXJ_15610 [Myxococcota bacterium]
MIPPSPPMVGTVHRTVLALLVLFAFLAVPGCPREDESTGAGESAWWWALVFGPQDLRLKNRAHDFDLFVHGNSPEVRVIEGSRSETIPRDALEPAAHEAGSFEDADAVRSVLLHGHEPSVGDLKHIGEWRLYVTRTFFALKHPDWPFAVASAAVSNGWLVSIDDERIGLIYPIDLAEHLRNE